MFVPTAGLLFVPVLLASGQSLVATPTPTPVPISPPPCPYVTTSTYYPAILEHLVFVNVTSTVKTTTFVPCLSTSIVDGGVLVRNVTSTATVTVTDTVTTTRSIATPV